MKTRTLYSIQVQAGPFYTKTLGNRLVPFRRARRVAAWLTGRGVWCYISPWAVAR